MQAVHEKPARLKVPFSTDSSDYSRDTGEFLFKIPFHDDTEIKILNVIPPEVLDIPQTFAPEIIERIIEVEEKISIITITTVGFEQAIIFKQREGFFRHINTRFQ